MEKIKVFYIVIASVFFISFLLFITTNNSNKKLKSKTELQNHTVSLQNNSIKNILEKENIGGKIKNNKVSLVMVGDVLIHSRVYEDAYKNNEYNFSSMLSEVKDELSKNDLVFYNQESIIGGKKIGLSTYPRLNSPEEIGEAMVEIGANLISLANNHTMDREEKAIKNSVEFWKKQKNVFATGSYISQEQFNKKVIFEKNGIKFAFLAYATLMNSPVKNKYNVDVFSKKKFLEDIKKVKEEKVDVVLVSIHWGTEYKKNTSKKQREIAKFLSENGVDIVIGTHPHVIEPIEKIGNTIVIYSLGNFLSSQIGEARRTGLFLTMNIEKENNKIKINNLEPKLIYVKYNNFKNFKVIPLWTEKWKNFKSKEFQDSYLEIIGDVSKMEIVLDKNRKKVLEEKKSTENKIEKKEKKNEKKPIKVFFKKQQASEEFKNIENKNLLPYNKKNFLPYFYIPKNLVKVSKKNSFKNREYFLISDANKSLEKMFSDGREFGLDLKIRSAYRSYKIQEIIKTEKIRKRGLEYANKYSADPGQSEHQLGTVVDITTKSVNNILTKEFENTPEYKWLLENSEKYGFKISYPKNNIFYNYEPWHFRWWGIKNL